ncbi:hypothetical protein Tco_0089473 [Tanacetum coccineum]
MPKSFLQIVASIEQCFELDSMLFDEAVRRLKAYEERIKGAEKMEDTQGGLLLASDGKSHGCKRCGNGGSNQDGFGRDRGRGHGSGKSQDGNERVDFRRISLTGFRSCASRSQTGAFQRIAPSFLSSYHKLDPQEDLTCHLPRACLMLALEGFPSSLKRISEKRTKNQAKTDKTEHGMEERGKAKVKSKPMSKVNREKSTVKTRADTEEYLMGPPEPI